MAEWRNLCKVVEDEDLASAETTMRNGEIEEIIDAVEKDFQRFENFGIVQDPPSDHYFISRKPNKFNNRKGTLIEKIQREWEVLRLFLAESSIYVRAYEERPDIMRAMMVGTEGTPYHHILFCFDIRLPTNYPAQPPELFYHSYDHFLNPKLNRNGTVNLAALNGDKGFWNFKRNSHPKPITVLQVLTTIQNSMFNKNPYLDETLHLTISGKGYNKQVLKQTSETMLCMLKSPPQNFEVFVQGHFRTKAHQILMNYKSHMLPDETTTKLLFKLIREFEANGTYCQHHYNKHSSDLSPLEEKLHEQKSEKSNSKKKANTFQGILS